MAFRLARSQYNLFIIRGTRRREAIHAVSSRGGCRSVRASLSPINLSVIQTPLKETLIFTQCCSIVRQGALRRQAAGNRGSNRYLCVDHSADHWNRTLALSAVGNGYGSRHHSCHGQRRVYISAQGLYREIQRNFREVSHCGACHFCCRASTQRRGL